MKRIVKDDSATAGCSKSYSTLDKFVTITNANNNLETLEEIVAKLAAKDGFSILGITKSEFIRKSIRKHGFSLPQQPSDVMSLVYKYYCLVKEKLVLRIKSLKEQNMKFSLSIDEWTSFKNRRYMNVHLYLGALDSVNLGLVPITGSCPAEKILEMVDLKLESFGICFSKDIVATTSDGASVMVKYGKLSPVPLQICYNHAVRLAIISVLYATKTTNNETSDDENSSCDSNEHEQEDTFLGKEDNQIDLISPNGLIINPDININDTIHKIRKVVKLFRKSPVRNSVLQNHVKAAEQKELALLLDCKTRWNTLESMVERLLHIIDPVKKALEDLNMPYLLINDDITNARNILDVLKPARIAIEALSRKDTTLITAEGVPKFLFKALEKNHSVLALKLLDELKERIGKRRDKSLVSLLKFLQDPSSLENVEDEFFSMTSKNEITKSAKNFMTRLFPAPPNDSRGNENLVLVVRAENSEIMEIQDSEFEPNAMKQQDTTITNEEFLKNSWKIFFVKATNVLRPQIQTLNHCGKKLIYFLLTDN